MTARYILVERPLLGTFRRAKVSPQIEERDGIRFLKQRTNEDPEKA